MSRMIGLPEVRSMEKMPYKAKNSPPDARKSDRREFICLGRKMAEKGGKSPEIL